MINPTTPRLARRQFLGALAAAGVCSVARPAVISAAEPEHVRPVFGTQLYGWGQYFEREGKRLADHLDEVFAALRDAGYDYAEGNLDSGAPDRNAAFAERLRAKGLRPVSLYTGGRLHDDGAERVVERLLAAAKVAKAAGFSILNCNPDPIGREKSEAELLRQLEVLKLLGQELKSIGLRFGIHHHTPELANGGREFHSNFRGSTAGQVDFCYDVHWVYRGGIQPMDALREYGARVVSWHLRQSREQIWWEDLDQGDLDYPAIARVARERRLAPFYTVELALEKGTRVTRGVVENHARSLRYVRQLFAA